MRAWWFLLSLALACSGAPRTKQTPDLEWLTGEWRTADSEEHWSASVDGLMVGFHQGAAAVEFLAIQTTDSGVYYVAWPPNQTPTRFRLVTSGHRSAVFENPAHDFPTRIEYQRTGDKLTATISGRRKRITWSFERAP